MKKPKKIIIVSILLFLFSCVKEKNNVHSENQQKFIEVYTELIKLSEQFPQQSPGYLDSSKKILAKYNFTKKDFEYCVSYYNKNPKRWVTFFQAAYDTLEQEKPD